MCSEGYSTWFVCLCVFRHLFWHYRQRGGLWAIPTVSEQREPEKWNIYFPKTTAFERYAVKMKSTKETLCSLCMRGTANGDRFTTIDYILMDVEASSCIDHCWTHDDQDLNHLPLSIKLSLHKFWTGSEFIGLKLVQRLYLIRRSWKTVSAHSLATRLWCWATRWRD